MDSCSDCLPCRIEWRPSLWLQALLGLLGLLAALCVLLSGLNLWLALPLALVAAARGLRLAWRERSRPPASVVWRGGGHPATLHQGERELCARVRRLNLRGPLAVMMLDTPTGPLMLSWWPDTLPASSRRALKLVRPPSPDSNSVLPLMAG